MKKTQHTCRALTAIISICILFIIPSAGQVPMGFNYQAVARDNAGTILANRNISMRMSITDSMEGTLLYQETHNVTTNQFGLITLQVGNGSAVFGDFSLIDWSESNAWLQVEMDADGGSSFVNMGTSPLLSVPYAMFAASGNPGPQGLPGVLPDGSNAGNTPYWDGAEWRVNSSNIFNNGGNIGMNYATPASQLHIQTNFDGDGIYMQPESSGYGIGITLFNTVDNVGSLGIAGSSGNWLPTSAPDDVVLKSAKANPILFGTNEEERMRINAEGNLGINTTAPEGKLHIAGNTNTSQLIIDASNAQSNTQPLLLLRNNNGENLLWIHSDDPSNSFIGLNSGRANNVSGGGLYNTFMGMDAGYSNTTGSANTAFGLRALYSNTTGYYNTATGVSALYANTTGIENTAHGLYALIANTTGSYNTANGCVALYYNTTGDYNTGNGYKALYSNITGTSNTADGAFALFFNTTGSNNTASGVSSLYANTTGYSNTAMGTKSLEANTSGYLNTAIGSNALISNTTGFQNAAFGANALYQNSTGFFNIAIGNNTMFSNTIGFQNTALGWDALYSNTEGRDNTAIGHNALGNNRTGIRNCATGSDALLNNTTGEDNTATGYRALFTNTTGNSNVANGIHAMYFNTGGYANTAVGLLSLYSNTTGFVNTALGAESLYSNTDGYSNTSTGTSSLYKNTSGVFNTAIGERALFDNTTGSYNTAAGQAAYFTSGDLSNTSCIGYFSGGVVNASNRIEIGNTSVGVIAGQVGFSTYSDARIKDNVQEDVPGLAFINLLRPVTYHLNIHRENAMVYKDSKSEERDWEGKYDIEKIKMTGFIAQDVEEAAEEIGYDFSGIQKPKNPDELYSLRYGDFVVPIVRAVQEVNVKLEIEMNLLKAENAALELRIERLEELIRLKEK